MRKLMTLLRESFQMYYVQVLIKTQVEGNKTEIYNQIRAITDVVSLTVVPNDQVTNASNDMYDYTLISIKFNAENLQEELERIKRQALKIVGLDKFYVRDKTLIKINNY